MKKDVAEEYLPKDKVRNKIQLFDFPSATMYRIIQDKNEFYARFNVGAS